MKTDFRQILVHLDNTARSIARLALARRIAEGQGAAVAVLHAVQPLYLTLPSGIETGPSAAAMLREQDDERRAVAKAAFERELTTAGPRATWSEFSDFPVIGAFAQQALFADLLVLGQEDRRDPASSDLPRDFVASVMAASGKPALVVPYAGDSPGNFDTIAIAWKETREASAAVCAAMPLLRRARKVIVMTWNEEPASAAPTQGSVLGLQSYLKLHDVEADFVQGQPVPGGAIGDLLLSRCADHGADLLVMGCYGHGRAREWILGGASRTVLRTMTLPVLMAH